MSCFQSVGTVGTFVKSHQYIMLTPACALAEVHALQTSIA